ncbi:MAG: cytochrome c3 family protein [Bryobacteraceae bacterium]|jgi:c(7)-type cytochrome triheme protein
MRFQVTIGVAVLAGLLLWLGPARVAAGGRLPTLSYRGSGYGKVVFDHQLHASEGFRCVDCHTDFAGTGKILFTTRKQGLITFADHTAGTKCFACHNGDGVPAERKGAFYNGKQSLDDCNHCHRKTGGF